MINIVFITKKIRNVILNVAKCHFCRTHTLKEIAELETEKKQIEQEVKLAMGEHELAVSGNYRVSWGNVDSTRLDTKRIKADYATVSHCRRFEVKAA